MFKRKKSQLDEIIEELQSEILNVLDPQSDEYEKAVHNLETLYQIKRDREVSKEAVLGAGSNLMGILAVLNFERIGVITSKAFTLVRNIRF